MADYKLKHTGAEVDSAIDNVNSNWSTLMANLGIGRWANQTFFSVVWASTPEGYYNRFYDDMADYYTKTIRMFAYSTWENNNQPMILTNDYTNQGKGVESAERMFRSFKATEEIQLSNMLIRNSNYMFDSSEFKRILVKEGCEVYLGVNYFCSCLFRNCQNLEEVGTIDFSKMVYSFTNLFESCSKLKHVHCKHFKFSFDIHQSTAFEESDLVEIISNLDPVSTTQTLTMGATNLAKLTDAEKQVATDKGWILA